MKIEAVVLQSTRKALMDAYESFSCIECTGPLGLHAWLSYAYVFNLLLFQKLTYDVRQTFFTLE